LIAEATSRSRWPAAVLTTAMMAIILFGVFLVIAPLDEMSAAIGAPLYVLGMLGGLLSLFGGGQYRSAAARHRARRSRKSLPRRTISDPSSAALCHELILPTRWELQRE
jgi:hypothetical protein